MGARCATTRHLQAGVRRRRGVRYPTIHSNKGMTCALAARPHATYRRVCVAGGVYDVQRYTAIIPRYDVRARCATIRHLQAGVRRRRGVRCPTIHSNKGLTCALAARPHATYRRVCVAGGVYDVQRYTAIIPRSDVRARCATTRHLQAGVRRRRGVRCPTIHSNKGLTWALAARPHATYRRVCVAGEVYDVQRYTAIKV